MCLDPAEDGMAWLSLHLEAERGVAIIARLDALADTERRTPAAAAPPRATRHPTRAARPPTLPARHPMLVPASSSASTSPPGSSSAARAPPTPHPPASSPRASTSPCPVLTLLGHTDQPAELDGYGPIDADTARRLAAHAPSFRRILTHPETGAYLSYGRTSYRVPADLAGYLRIRDGGCRFPGCTRTAVRTDIDHTTDWQSGGHTRHDNLAHLCRKHHRLKHHTPWSMTQQPGGEIRWTSPAGREHTTTPAHPFAPARPPDPARRTRRSTRATAALAAALARYPDEPPWEAPRPASSEGEAA